MESGDPSVSLDLLIRSLFKLGATRLDIARHLAFPQKGRAALTASMHLKHVECLIDGNGDITIGSIGPIRCAAMAADDDQQLAALVRRRGESFLELLQRLDAALAKAWNEDVFIDEINGPG